MKTSIALVGRPNVGKSRLFNRLINRRISIVHDQPGITRDVIAEETNDGVIIMDTGGIGLSQDLEVAVISQAVEEQVEFAIRAADVIFFVVDGRQGCVPLDLEIADLLRKSGKKVYLIINKIDNKNDIHLADQFAVLGDIEQILISAEHGYGDDQIRNVLKQYASHGEQGSENIIKICFAGRPNVGKSSLTNSLLNDKRMIISDIPGTTRDSVAVNVPFQYNDQEYIFKLFDTAGLREKKKINNTIEFFSSLRSHDAIEKSDIVLIVIDAMTGITRQDKKLAGEVLKQGKSLILIVNKWDIAYKGIDEQYVSGYQNITEFRQKFETSVREELFHLKDFPIVFVSAKTGFHVDDILKQCVEMYKRLSQNISTGGLNRLIQKLLQKQPPAVVSGKRFKIYYLVHAGTFPHTFKVFCNKLQRLTEPYKRYLQNSIVENFDLSGCPVNFIWHEKEARYSQNILD